MPDGAVTVSMKHDASAETAAVLAARWVDGGHVPEGQQPAAWLALARALKALCYEAWHQDPGRAARGAELLAVLAGTAPADAAPDTVAEVQALAEWTGGIAAVTRGRMAEAAQRLQAASAQFAAIGRPDSAAQCQVPRIMALAMLGRHDEAARCADAARQALRALGDLAAAARVTLNLGSLLLRQDDYAAAAERYREAAVMFARLGDQKHSVMADIGMADALTGAGEFDEAQLMYRRAGARADAHDEPMLRALVAESAALLDLARGEYGKALEGFERARAGYEALNLPQHLAIAEKQLADAYLALRLVPEALDLYGRAQSRFDALEMPDDAAWTRVQQGRALALTGDAAGAGAQWSSARSSFGQQDNEVGVAAVELAEAEWAVHIAVGPEMAEAALASTASATAWQQRAGRQASVDEAGLLHARALRAAGRLSEAAVAARDVAAAAARRHRLGLQADALALQGRCAEAQGRCADAVLAYEAAIRLTEDQLGALQADELRAAYLAEQLHPYRGLCRAALRQHDKVTSAAAEEDAAALADEAATARDASRRAAIDVLAAQERWRSAALGDRERDIRGGARHADDASPGHATLQNLRARYQWLQRRAQSHQDEGGAPGAGLSQAIGEVEAALLEGARRLRFGHGSTSDDGAGTAAPRDVKSDDAEVIAMLRAALAEDEAVISYGVLDGELFAGVITRHAVTLHRRLADWAAVTHAVQAVRFQIETLCHGATVPEAHLPMLVTRCHRSLARLTPWLWAPVEAALAGCRRLLIVAPGVLAAVPFAALPLHADDAAGQTAPTLQDRCALAHTYSLRGALAGLQRQATPPTAVTVVADERRLAAAATEADMVAGAWPRSQVLMSEAASVAAVEHAVREATLLHIACHAHHRADNPRFSALELVDGPLTAFDLEQLHMPAATVVLGGCETALAGAGALQRGGAGPLAGAGLDADSGGDRLGLEMVGLVRGFLGAGAARVVASLWPVDDAATLLFMQAFHAALREGQAPADALRTARQRLRATHPHPAHWAAFVVYGGW